MSWQYLTAQIFAVNNAIQELGQSALDTLSSLNDVVVTARNAQAVAVRNDQTEKLKDFRDNSPVGGLLRDYEETYRLSLDTKNLDVNQRSAELARLNQLAQLMQKFGGDKFLGISLQEFEKMIRESMGLDVPAHGGAHGVARSEDIDKHTSDVKNEVQRQTDSVHRAVVGIGKSIEKKIDDVAKKEKAERDAAKRTVSDSLPAQPDITNSVNTQRLRGVYSR